MHSSKAMLYALCLGLWALAGNAATLPESSQHVRSFPSITRTEADAWQTEYRRDTNYTCVDLKDAPGIKTPETPAGGPILVAPCCEQTGPYTVSKDLVAAADIFCERFKEKTFHQGDVPKLTYTYYIPVTTNELEVRLEPWTSNITATVRSRFGSPLFIDEVECKSNFGQAIEGCPFPDEYKHSGTFSSNDAIYSLKIEGGLVLE